MKAAKRLVGHAGVATLAIVTFACENTGKAKEGREATEATKDAAGRAAGKGGRRRRQRGERHRRRQADVRREGRPDRGHHDRRVAHRRGHQP